MSESDARLRVALQEARKSLQLTSPNPRVGCVLSDENSERILGLGHTQRAGWPHAEVMALRDAAERGHSVVGSTAYVTLEPCSHHGRTGPCCDALIAAGIKKVVATNTDPNPLVAGRGFARLRTAGIDVQVLPPDHPLAIESRELNIGFFSRMVRRTPWVRMKAAISLDGKTALPDGTSQWITGEQARADGHCWRARACAVLTGIGTVYKDNPRLNVRLANAPRQPHVVIVDSALQTPVDAHLFVAGRAVYIYCCVQNAEKMQALEVTGATVIYMPGTDGHVNLRAMLQDLAMREINELHVEAGARLNGALLTQGLVDELVIYLAPSLMGEGLPMAQFGPLSSLVDATAMQFTAVDRVGDDLRIVARVRGRDTF